MAQPLPKPNQPLLDVLAVYGVTATEFDQMLRDGADEIERLLPKLLEKHTTGGKVKAAQLLLVRKELAVVQSALWGDLGRSLRSGVASAVLRAAEGAPSVLATALGRQGVRIPALEAAYEEQARQGIQAVLAKAKNGIPLSRAVYRTQALATDQVNKKVSLGLLLGMNAKAIAKSVKDLIRPEVKGGVSYAAKRLARTEINHAYQTSQAMRYEEDPTVKAMRWNLSKSHPGLDICNVLATAPGPEGAGTYPKGQKPDSHPNCLCYQTTVSVSEDEFLDAFLAGDYNTYIDEVAYTYAPTKGLPCP